MINKRSFVSHHKFCSQKAAMVRFELVLTIQGGGGWCRDIAQCIENFNGVNFLIVMGH